MVVIDDPVSILRCTNKIYLHDLLKSKKLPTPRTEILFRTMPSVWLRCPRCWACRWC
jgi:glutathione synthase/RimK-type ligase-like ATP-grasp enzyme